MFLFLGYYCLNLSCLPVLPFCQPNHFFLVPVTVQWPQLPVGSYRVEDGNVKVRWASAECESVARRFT